MRSNITPWRRRAVSLLAGALAPCALSMAAPAAQPPAPVPAVSAPASARLSLPTCRQIALEHQPALVAARASLAAAVARSESLEHLPSLAALVARDLPIRKKQACLGIQVAQAALAQAEADTLHGVTFAYLAARYARRQQTVADDAIANLKTLQDTTKQAVDDGTRKDISQRDLDRIDIYLLTAESQKQQAVQGYERALAALREAMGTEADFELAITDPMPWPNGKVEREQIVALAVSRRGEIGQASLAVQVSCLEVDAQGKKRLPQATTFASGSDIHAQPLPAGQHDENYRPAAVGPEMPTIMAGSRKDRIEQAKIYQSRADAVAAKTRGLIELEAEQAYFRWLEAHNKLKPAIEAADRAEKLSNNLRDAFDPRAGRVTPEELLNAGLLATQLRLASNQAAYQELQALAVLERVTGGAFRAGFDN